MSRHLQVTAVLLLVQILSFPLTRRFGLYNEYWYTDVILHILAGTMFASFWLWLVRRSSLSSVFRSLTAVIFAVFASFLWEVWEFVGWRLMGHLTPNYVPTLSDTLGDISAGLLGGVILVLIDRLYRR